MPDDTAGSVPQRSLADWLDYQQKVHPRSIALGLDRVREVWQRLGCPRPAPIVLSIAGTNGKGSTVAFLEAMLVAAGRRVGCYTSPHLLRYNERVRVGGVDVDDAALIDAFERIERARGDIALTYFEFGTLAALYVFSQSGLDVALLEVGLGGRLDAVNLVDADAAIVTTIDLDHQDWLGDDRDSIGREKAGIFRRGHPAVIADPSPPDGLVDAARDIGANVVRAGVDFRIERDASGWRWIGGDTVVALPDPTLAAPCQHANAAGAIALLHAMRDRLGFDPAALARGVVAARVPGRLQQSSGQPGLIIDVAHNPQAARVLARWLADHPVDGRTFAVFSALGDKDIAGIGAAVAAQIDRWFVAGLDAETDRGLDAERVAAKLDDVADQLSRHADVTRALDAAFESRGSGDRIVAFGSFHVAAAALRWKPAGTDRA